MSSLFATQTTTSSMKQTSSRGLDRASTLSGAITAVDPVILHSTSSTTSEKWRNHSQGIHFRFCSGKGPAGCTSLSQRRDRLDILGWMCLSELKRKISVSLFQRSSQFAGINQELAEIAISRRMGLQASVAELSIFIPFHDLGGDLIFGEDC